MLVDHERVLLEVKALVAAKPSHGASALLAAIAELEVSHRVDEGEMEMWTRRFGGHLYDSFMGLLPRASEATDPLAGADLSGDDGRDGGAPHLRRPTDSEESCHRQKSMIAPGLPVR